MSTLTIEEARACVLSAQKALDEARSAPNTRTKRDRLIAARRAYESARADLRAVTAPRVHLAAVFAPAALAVATEGAYV